MEKIDLSWNTLLIESELKYSMSSEFLNSLFYSDKLHYSSLEAQKASRLIAAIAEESTKPRELIVEIPMEIFRLSTQNEDERAGIHFEAYLIQLRSLSTRVSDTDLKKAAQLYVIAMGFGLSLFSFKEHVELDLDYRRDGNQPYEDGTVEVPDDIKVIEVNTPHVVSKNLWSPHEASENLRKALMKTKLLPDISNLKFGEVIELKQDVKAYFDPFRAELLKMTSTLRSMVSEEMNQKEIEAEAINLVLTEVEPVLRIYTSKLESELNNKFNNYAKKTLNVLAFTGLGFFFPNMFAQAAKSAIDVVGDALTEDKDMKTGTEISRFAMKLNSYAK